MNHYICTGVRTGAKGRVSGVTLMRVNTDERDFYEFAVSNWRADGICTPNMHPYPVRVWHRSPVLRWWQRSWLRRRWVVHRRRPA